MVGKKGLFELKNCTVSGLKRQFDKWHLFRAPTGGGGVPILFLWVRGFFYEQVGSVPTTPDPTLSIVSGYFLPFTLQGKNNLARQK